MDSFIVQFWGRILSALRWISPLEWIFVARPHLRTHGWVDVWVLLNLALSVVTLVAASFAPGSCFVTLLLVYAGLRLVDVVAYQAKVVLFDPYRYPRSTSDYAVRSYRRIVLLALHNYAEAALWFAAIYSNYRNLFATSSGEFATALSTPIGAFYFSMVTMVTLGYGEITPKDDYGRAIVIPHLFISLFMTLVILARFVSFLPVPRTLDKSEINDKSETDKPAT